MAIKHYSTLCLSFIISFNALSVQTESTDQYAFGAKLNLADNESMFSRIELDSNIYTQTVSPTLDDIRVFNRNGKIVPFSLVDVYDKQQNKQQVEMILYPMNQNNFTTSTESDKSNYIVSIQGQNVNISVDQIKDNPSKYVNRYLLQLPNDDIPTNPISNLKLTFEEQAENWQATAYIAHSSDLKYWNNVIKNVPVMVLNNNQNQTLSLTDIRFQPSQNYKNVNWIITLYSQKPIPKLTHVTASSEITSINSTLYPINFSLTDSDEQSAVYRLPTAVLIKELGIELEQSRSVLPVSIFYKTNSKDEQWHKLEDRIIRKTDYDDQQTHIPVKQRLISQLKIVPLNSSFEQPPKVIAYRNKVDLVFNSANNAPFILAWGSATSKAAALPATLLLSNYDDVSSLPQAFIGDSVKLAGAEVLMENNSPSSGIPHWIIWLGLMLGAGILVTLALKLFKEIKNDNAT